VLFYYTHAFNIFLSSIISAKLADTSIGEIFGIPADTLSNLTLFYPLSITDQIDWHTWFTFRSLANTCLRIPVCGFCVNTSFGTPSGTGNFNMVDIGDASEVNEGNYVPVDENKLKEDQKKEYLELVEKFKHECLKSYSVTRSGDVIKKFNLPSF